MSAQAEPPEPVLVSVRNPANGEIIGQYLEQTVEEVRAAIRQAHAAQSAWNGTPIAQRRRCITRMRMLLLAQTDEIAQLISSCV
ncbi:MAG: aldehyde dehydrogenase family protein, partial [Gammaproteobacteria bacterium]